MSESASDTAAGVGAPLNLPNDAGSRRNWALIGAMMLIGAPGIYLRLSGTHPPDVLAAITFGVAILAAAFLLSWAVETAQLDISQGLALAVIALIAVLPEYAVDFVLAWEAGSDPEEAEKGLAIANMTGGNRLLIGVGWPLVFLLWFLRTKNRALIVDRARALELAFLAVATAYVIFLPLRDHISLADSVVLISLFICYLFFISKQEAEEVELIGPSETLGRLQNRPRRIAVVGLLIYAGVVIFASAEPFAHALVDIGEEFGISEFFLIQWLAPLASESPEVLIASLLAWRGRAAAGMGALISSKVNQWTLLIGTLPIAFSLAAGEFHFFSGGLPLDDRQREELFLTAAQSAFAIAVFINLRMQAWEAAALFILFATQLFITNEQVRIVYAFAYAALCLILLIIHWRDVKSTSAMAWSILRGRQVDEHPPDEAPSQQPTPGGGT